MSELGGAVQVVVHRAKQVEVLGGVGAVAVVRGIHGMSGAPINTVAEFSIASTLNSVTPLYFALMLQHRAALGFDIKAGVSIQFHCKRLFVPFAAPPQ